MSAKLLPFFRRGAALVMAAIALTISTSVPAAASEPESEHDFTVSVWADNWFAFYVNGELVGEDSTPVTEIRSFNSDTFTFRAAYPLTVSVVTRDYIENDSGLEYIGSFFGLFPVSESFTVFQQIGDGGFIAQVTEAESGRVIATTSQDWRGLVVHRAPLNPDCEKSTQPLADCDFYTADEPENWKSADFDDTGWGNATEYTADQIGARFGYNDIDWVSSASLIWTEDIEA
ncbi:MAG: hypothetical protein ACFB0Z_07600, partial [Candidatus Phaeomarinobacter sp.]